MKPLTIGQVAKRAGVGIETLRFYEREGLIEEPPRKESGYRQYPEDVISRLRFIKRAKELGFTLKEIKELLSLQADPEKACDRVIELAEAKVAEMDKRTRTLKRTKEALKTLLTASCRECAVQDCSIMQSLSQE